jgi:hypothetical protein
MRDFLNRTQGMNRRIPRVLIFFLLFWSLGCCLSSGWLGGDSWAGPLSDRLEQFPHWTSQPPLKPAQGNLHYPDWFLGEWEVTSTLTALEAPLAPEIVTPGFADQKQSLNQPVVFRVRFVREPSTAKIGLALVPDGASSGSTKPTTIADQAYNSRSLITAYLGKGAVQSITVDPKDPTRQVTRLRGDRKLTSVISDRAIDAEFITSELFQQIFSSASQVYVNQVENTTDYRLASTEQPQIEADQVTAIYLSPQDPQYFKAGNRPVALYRYHLTLNVLD